MKPISTTVKGVIISVVLMLSSVISFYKFHLPQNGSIQFVFFGLYAAGLLWALISVKSNSNPSSIKDYFSEGFKAFIVVTLFMTVYTFVFYKFNPQILENAILENNAIIQKQGSRTQAEIEANAQKLRSIFMPMMLAVNMIIYLFFGALISVVLGGFLSRKNN